jgi:dihydroxy-acid dehydratase
VKRGVYEAGGFPLEFPIMSLGETLLKPTAMLFRNLASMDAEESIRGNPIDGVVLLTGCDKTTPSTLMGAASVDLPTLVVPGGPMLNGKYRGTDIGSGTSVWKLTDELKTGKITYDEYSHAESCMSRSPGHCMTMGTASTMACMVEALGMCLSGAAAIPAVDSRKKVLAQLSGRRIVEMVKEDLRISKILTREAFENAIMVNAAVGGSSNLLIHLTAIAGRARVKVALEDFDAIGSKVPLLLNLMPSGKFLMEDFYYAGGLPVVINELRSLLHMDVLTVSGKSHRENIAGRVSCFNRDVIAEFDKPFIPSAGIVVLKGNLNETSRSCGGIRKYRTLS